MVYTMLITAPNYVMPAKVLMDLNVMSWWWIGTLNAANTGNSFLDIHGYCSLKYN